MAQRGRVQNKAVASRQITFEQLIRESHEIPAEQTFERPEQRITDQEELDDYRFERRKDFEDKIRRNRTNPGAFLNYAVWEEKQSEFKRVRSIFERCLSSHPRNTRVWVRYADFEQRHGNANHARNVWDRAVTQLPREDELWLKYVHLEQTLGNIPAARRVFERWMEWEPELRAWFAYINLESRFEEWDRVRAIYERFLRSHPTVSSYLKYAKFEERRREVARARAVLERCAGELGELSLRAEYFSAFASFEERHSELERARALYKYALDHLPKDESGELYRDYIVFEKKNGSQSGIEQVIVEKRRLQYEEQLAADSVDYDCWFDFCNLEEANGDPTRIRAVYERAVASVPPIKEKRYWARYIYLWLAFAIYEELVADDIERARDVFRRAVRAVPHRQFSFAKLWVAFAHFEIRQMELAAARKIMGNALGVCARKGKIYREYIAIETALHNHDRCRKLYEGSLAYAPHNCSVWTEYAAMEAGLAQIERARAIYELAIDQPVLDMPEILWKAYIDFEIAQEEYGRVRALYEKLLERTTHVKVWVSYAQFECSLEKFDETRALFGRAYDTMKKDGRKEERLLVLESWRDFETEFGNDAAIAEVNAKMPQRVRKKRPLRGDDGEDLGWEEYHDLVFPDDPVGNPNLKILEMAQRWKKQKV